MSDAYNIDPISHADHAHNVMYVCIFFPGAGGGGGNMMQKKSSVIMQKARGCVDNEVKPP